MAYKPQTSISHSSGGWQVQDQGAGKSKIKVLSDSVSGEDQLRGSYMDVSLLCPHMGKGVRELSGVSFIKALIPFMRTPPS